jgi:XTP/dITP diphosphohydrolase
MQSKRSLPLVIGTHNRKKGAELAEMLTSGEFHVVMLADCANAIEVVENGNTFKENAALKAMIQAKHLGEWVLADDSGLEVDALGGRPGVCSARFAGAQSTDEDNNRELLKQLRDMTLDKRTAQYVCHVALADPTGAVRAESHEICRGRILFESSGTNGFGYDPLFEVVEYHRTFGELGRSVKRAISHRSRAIRAILPQVRQALDIGQETGM